MLEGLALCGTGGLRVVVLSAGARPLVGSGLFGDEMFPGERKLYIRVSTTTPGAVASEASLTSTQRRVVVISRAQG